MEWRKQWREGEGGDGWSFPGKVLISFGFDRSLEEKGKVGGGEVGGRPIMFGCKRTD